MIKQNRKKSRVERIFTEYQTIYTQTHRMKPKGSNESFINDATNKMPTNMNDKLAKNFRQFIKYIYTCIQMNYFRMQIINS